MSFQFPKFLSGLAELENVWLLGDTYLSGILKPFPHSNVLTQIGTSESVFAAGHFRDLFNQYGVLSINTMSSSAPLDVAIDSGMANVTLQYDETLSVVNGQLSVKPILRMNNEHLDLRFQDPIKILWDEIADPVDTFGGKLFLDYSDTDFTVSNEGKLSIIRPPEVTYTEPLLKDTNANSVTLNYDEGLFQVEQGKLKTKDLTLKGLGAVKTYNKSTEALGEVFDWLEDFGGILDQWEPLWKFIAIKTSDDFVQTGSRLHIKGKTPGCIPFYQIGNGFNTNTGFKYDDSGTLSVRFVQIENSFSLQDNYAASVGYVNQVYQSGDGTAIDISQVQNGRRVVSVRTDDVSVKKDAQNRLTSALVFDAPLQLTNSNVSLGVVAPLVVTGGSLDVQVDGTTITKTSGSLSAVAYTAGKGIQINNHVISTSEDVLDDLTFHFPLVKAANVVRLDMSGIDPISVNDLTGKVSLKTDTTLQVVGGALGVVPVEPLTNGNGILIENNRISLLANLHHFNFVNSQTEIRLKSGGLIESDMEGLFVSLTAENGIFYENGIMRLLFDLSHFKLSAGDELQLNLSNTFSATQTGGLTLNVDGTTVVVDTQGRLTAPNTTQVTSPVTKDPQGVLGLKYDSSTLKVDPTVGLAGNYQAKAGTAITIMGNLVSENLTVSSPLTRTGNNIALNLTGSNGVTVSGGSVQGSYSGVGMVYVSGSQIGIRDSDLDQRIQDKTGISQPSSGGGGGGDNPFSSLGKGLSNLGSLIAGGVGGLFGGLAGGLASGAISSTTGMASSGILSTITAGISAAGAAVSIGATLSHGFAYGAAGVSVGNLEEGSWGFSFGTASQLYPSVYTDKLKSVAAIGPLVGGSNTTLVNSDSFLTGALVVNGGVGIRQNLHVGGQIQLNGGISLNYGTLFVANHGDINHCIAHGMSGPYNSTFNNDGIVLHTGVGGAYLAMTGEKVLFWHVNAVRIYKPLITESNITVTGNVNASGIIQATQYLQGDTTILGNTGNTDAQGLYISWNTRNPGIGCAEFVSNCGLGSGAFNFFSKRANDPLNNVLHITYEGDMDLPGALHAGGNIFQNGSPVSTITYVNDQINALDAVFPTFQWVNDTLTGYYTKPEVISLLAPYATKDSVFSKTESDGRYLPITYSPPAFPDLTPYILKSTADTLYKSITYQPDLSAYLTVVSGDAKYLPITYTPPSVDLTPFALNSNVYNRVESDTRFKGINWQPDLTPFALSSNVYSKSESDTKYINNSGALTVDSSQLICNVLAHLSAVALRGNTLFIGVYGDNEHFISHGKSEIAAAFDIDGMVLNGYAGGVLGAQHYTILRWKTSGVDINVPLTVNASLQMNNISFSKGYLGDTNMFWNSFSAVNPEGGGITFAPSIWEVRFLQDLKIATTTDSTSPSTGAVAVAGGLGVQKSLVLGGNTYIPSTVAINFGYEVANREPNAGRIGYNLFTSPALEIVGAGADANTRVVKIYDVLVVNGYIDSNSATTGALTVNGGMGIGKSLFVNGWISVPYNSRITVGHANNIIGSVDADGGWSIPNLKANDILIRPLNSAFRVVTADGASSTFDVLPSGVVAVNSGIESDSATTGALTVVGGVGIQKNLHVGGVANLSTVTSFKIQNATSASSSSISFHDHLGIKRMEVGLVNGFNAINATGGMTFSNPNLTLAGKQVATQEYVTSAINSSWNKNAYELNSATETNSPCYIDFHSAAGGDYNMRIIREGGVDGPALIEQLGTAPLTINVPQCPGLSLHSTDNPSASNGGVVFNSSIRVEAAVAINGYSSQEQMSAYYTVNVMGAGNMPTTQFANVSLYCRWGIVSNNYFTHSDRRLKTNVRVIPNALEAFDAIDACMFDWKDPSGGKNAMGFIAQDVMEVLPHCVRALPTDSESDPFLTVDYQAMNVLLWQVVKELRAEIQEWRKTQ